MKTMVLTQEDIRIICRQVGIDRLMDQLIDRLKIAYLVYDPKRTVIPARDGFSYTAPVNGLVEWMPVMEGGSQVTIKVVGYHPENPARFRLPTIISTVSAYDICTGHLTALADGTFITALRTGANSAVASEFMAAKDSRVLGIIGCGSQAVTQLHALSRLFALEKVLVYDVQPEVSASFLKRTAFSGLEVIAVDEAGLDDLVGAADILCTCTSVGIGAGPVFNDVSLKPWVHINAVGSDFPGKYEVPLSVLKRSTVCPDFREQAVNEGECQQLAPEEIGPSLVEVIQDSRRYAYLKDRMTVFDSTGWALEDQVAVDLLVELAQEIGVGTRIDIEQHPADPQDPYEFIHSDSSAVMKAKD